MEAVYKVLRKQEWDEFNEAGKFIGSEHDLRDGFIHLSVSTQVDGVINKYFKNEKTLFIIKIIDSNLLKKLKWEASGSGEIFPHLYNTPILLENVDSFESPKECS